MLAPRFRPIAFAALAFAAFGCDSTPTPAPTPGGNPPPVAPGQPKAKVEVKTLPPIK